MSDYWINAPIKVVDDLIHLYEWDTRSRTYIGGEYDYFIHNIGLLGDLAAMLFEPLVEAFKPLLELVPVKQHCIECNDELENEWNYCPRCGQYRFLRLSWR